MPSGFPDGHIVTSVTTRHGALCHWDSAGKPCFNESYDTAKQAHEALAVHVLEVHDVEEPRFETTRVYVHA